MSSVRHSSPHNPSQWSSTKPNKGSHSNGSGSSLNAKPLTNGHSKDGGSLSNINLKAVERIDNGAKEILKTISCVVIYKYLEDSESWERTPMEGTLFIYSRDVSVISGSSNAFIILSKLTNEHLLVHLHRGMNLHINCPFVLFKKTEKDTIYGMNFTNEMTCNEVGKELLRLCRNSKPSSTPNNQKLSIHGRNNLTPSPTYSDHSDSQDEVRSHDGHLSNSVRQRKDQSRKQRQSSNRRSSSESAGIIIKASRNRRETSPAYTGHTHSSITTPLSGHTHSKHDKSSNLKSKGKVVQYTGSTVSNGDSPNLVKKLFQSSTEDQPNRDSPLTSLSSDTPPVVHHLFASVASSNVITTPTSNNDQFTPPKRMFSVTELEDQITKVQDGEVSLTSMGSPVPVPKLLHPSAFSNSSPSLTTIENTPANGQSSDHMDSKPEVNLLPPTPVDVTPPLMMAAKFPAIPLLVQSPGMRSQPVATATDHTPSTLQSISESSQSGPTNQTTASIEAPPTSKNSTLMSPQVFSGVNRSTSEPTKFKTESTTSTTGLTQQQLQQALLHLIKTDSSFLTTLHEAYVDSLRSSTR